VTRAFVGIAAVALLAGCGGSRPAQAPPPPPRLPHALGQAWSREADAVAAALAANDGCTAEQQAGRLRAQVIAAINAGRVPHPLLEPLTSAVNALPARITCTPPKPKPPKPPKPPKHGHGHGHDHGNDKGDGGG
jgi:hypothetical protein